MYGLDTCVAYFAFPIKCHPVTNYLGDWWMEILFRRCSSNLSATVVVFERCISRLRHGKQRLLIRCRGSGFGVFGFRSRTIARCSHHKPELELNSRISQMQALAHGMEASTDVFMPEAGITACASHIAASLVRTPLRIASKKEASPRLINIGSIEWS